MSRTAGRTKTSWTACAQVPYTSFPACTFAKYFVLRPQVAAITHWHWHCGVPVPWLLDIECPRLRLLCLRLLLLCPRLRLLCLRLLLICPRLLLICPRLRLLCPRLRLLCPRLRLLCPRLRLLCLRGCHGNELVRVCAVQGNNKAWAQHKWIVTVSRYPFSTFLLQ